VVSELNVKFDLLLGVVMAPKKTRKQLQNSMLEERVEDQVAPPESIRERNRCPGRIGDELESEEEQRS